MGIRENRNQEKKMYVHYGSSDFDRDRFIKVENRKYHIKPNGGLWGSPVDSAAGWKQWYIENNFREIKEDNCFYFRMRGWQIYEVEAEQDLQKLPHIQMSEELKKLFVWHDKMLDFEEIMRDEHYFFKSMVACISDGRIVETCGYTEQEAKEILDEIMKDMDGIREVVLENRKD